MNNQNCFRSAEECQDFEECIQFVPCKTFISKWVEECCDILAEKVQEQNISIYLTCELSKDNG